MERITEKQLQSVVDRINRIAGTPMTPYVKGDDGKYHPQANNYHLDFAYGGVQLVQMCNEGGGTRNITQGHVSKRELLYLMQAFIAGIETKVKA